MIDPLLQDDEAIQRLAQTYDLSVSEFRLNTTRLRIMHVRDWEALVDGVSEEEFASDEQLPYWAEVWPSAVALSHFLAETDVAPPQVLELGAGLGLVGLSLAKTGRTVAATDISPLALEFLKAQARINEVDLQVFRLDWRAIPDQATVWPGIVAADVLYERRAVVPLLQALGQLLPPGGEAWVADPFRATADDFPALATAAGYEVAMTETAGQWKAHRQRVRIFYLKKVG